MATSAVVNKAGKTGPSRRGRPRSFDRDEALRKAMRLFWEVGYDGATLESLQSAMGIVAAPSFYAAFGSKEQLFREAVDLYCTSVFSMFSAAMESGTTARESIGAVMHAASRTLCSPDRPRGCLVSLGIMNCTHASRGTQRHLRNLRRKTEEVFLERLERGVTAGDVPRGVDIAALASFYATIVHGLSIQARDGSSHEALKKATECAMAAWDMMVARRKKR